MDPLLLGFIGYLVAALAFAILAVLLARRRQSDRVGSVLLGAVGCTVAWAIAMAGLMRGDAIAASAAPLVEAARSLAWILFLIQLAAARPAAAAGAVAGAVGDGRRTGAMGLGGPGGPGGPSGDPIEGARRRALLIAAVLAIASVAIDLSSASITMMYAIMTLIAVFGLVCVEQVYRNTPVARRWGIKFLAVALAALFGFDLLMYSEAMLFAQVDANWLVTRGFANALLVPLLAISAARNPQWKLDIGVSRRVVFHSAALTVAGGYLVLIAAGGYYLRWFGGAWGAVAQTLLLFAALIGLAVVLMSGKLRAQLRVFVSKHFFSYRFDYREEWMRLTHLLTSGNPEPGPAGAGQPAPHPAGTLDLPSRAILGLGRPIESQSGAIWLESDGAYRFEGGVRWRSGRAPIELDASLAAFLREREWIIDLAEVQAGPTVPPRPDAEAYEGLVLPPEIAGHDGGWLIVPLLLEGELLGFVVLDRPIAPQIFDWETRDLLKAAASQIASQIGMQRALEKLIRAQQFESFNRMSAFVVHDLKNLVAQLGLMTKNAQRHRDNPEFQADMLSTVENVRARMQGLLLQLRAGARPVEQRAPVPLAEVVQAAVTARRGLLPEPRISLDADQPPAITMAHRERLERVVGHLVQNAAEACGVGGRVEIRLGRDGERGLIEVEDDGRGMSESFIRDRLFQPFDSTKAHGMGIGAFESREYLREIGGMIEVDSTEGVGTIFRIRLPLVIGTGELQVNRSLNG